MTARIVIAGGVATLNQATMNWAKSIPVAEVQIVVRHGQIPSPNIIHDNGIKIATLNPWNDVGNGPNDPETVPGYAQAIIGAGWDMIAGEGVAGNVVADIENHGVYCNYAGCCDGAGGQIDAYASPWSHPRSGGRGHCDYIETYVSGGGVPSVQSCIDRLNQAKSYGSIHHGPLVGLWGNYPCSANDIFHIIEATGSDSICFWTGYDYEAYNMIQTYASGILNGVISRYGVTPSYGMWGDGSSKAAAPAAAKPAAATSSNTGPKKVLSIAFSDGTKGETSRSVKAKDIINIVGKSGYLDANENWTATPNPQMVWAWRIRTGADGKEIWEDLGKQWPNKAGDFNYLVTWNKRETCKYKVGLVGI